MNRNFHGPAALLLALGLASGAMADTRTDGSVAARTLRYEAAELRNPAGARRVYAQIRLIAGQVCEAQDGAGLERKALHASCVRTTVDGAVAKLGAPLVTALHEGRTATAVAWAGR